MSASRNGVSSRWALVGLAVLLLATAPAIPQPPQPPPRPPAKPAPRLEPVAETKLLMQGLNDANFDALSLRLVQNKPANLKDWSLVRGQALLIAEAGNLLMLRPPRNQGQDAWLDHCRDLREAATTLARHAANQDYPHSRAALRDLAGACNQCHQTFRVNVQIAPAGER
jgi:hypothetical protein